MTFMEDNLYFSLSDLLLTEERIHSEIQVELPNLGYLCVSSKEDHLKQGTRLDLPLWLADSIRKHSRRMLIITCEIPKIYRDNYREILHADACAVELSKWNPFFYELGLQLPISNQDEKQKICEFLLEVFKNRFRIIMDWEENPFITPAQRSQLTHLERKLLVQGHSARLQLLNWLNKGVRHIETSNVLNTIRKRKSFDV